MITSTQFTYNISFNEALNSLIHHPPVNLDDNEEEQKEISKDPTIFFMLDNIRYPRENTKMEVSNQAQNIILNNMFSEIKFKVLTENSHEPELTEIAEAKQAFKQCCKKTAVYMSDWILGIDINNRPRCGELYYYRILMG